MPTQDPRPISIVYQGRRLSHDGKLFHSYQTMEGEAISFLAMVARGHVIGGVYPANLTTDTDGARKVGPRPGVPGRWEVDEDLEKWDILDRAAETQKKAVKSLQQAATFDRLTIAQLRRMYNDCRTEAQHAAMIATIIARVSKYEGPG